MKKIVFLLALFLGTCTSSYAVEKYDYLIFLDIDGVLNNADSDVTTLYVFEQKLANHLKPLFNLEGKEGMLWGHYKAKTGIVLSTTWRYKAKTREELKRFIEGFNQKDWGWEIPLFFSSTPNLDGNRTKEIGWWLNWNTDNIHLPEVPMDAESRFPEDLPKTEYLLKEKLSTVKNYVIIDDYDMNDNVKDKGGPALKAEIKKHFVLIDKKPGLTEKDVEKALHILKDRALQFKEVHVIKQH